MRRRMGKRKKRRKIVVLLVVDSSHGKMNNHPNHPCKTDKNNLASC